MTGRACVRGPAYCRIPVYRIDDDGRTRVSFEDFETPEQKTAYTARLALEDAPAVRALAEQIVQGIDDPVLRLAALHNWRAAHIRYHLEPRENFDSPLHLLAVGVGDCEDFAALGGALAVALGYRFALPTCGGTRASPSHQSLWVCADPDAYDDVGQVPEWGELAALSPPPGWYWSDTTPPAFPFDARGCAAFGEHPLAAAARLR